MLFETDTAWVEAAGRVATLWLNGATIADVGRVVAAVRDCPFVEILVVRSATPAFAVATPFVDDRHDFAVAGRRVLKQLEDLPIPTLAFIDGPCRGPGLELAVACDYRLAVATPDTWLSLDAPAWGGTARLRTLIGPRALGAVTAREARAVGLVDHAFCRRRAKIELRTWLDRLEDRPRKRRRPWFGWRRTLRLDAEELAAFVQARGASKGVSVTPCSRRGLVVELRRCPQAAPFAAEYALRGGTVVTDDPAAVCELLAEPFVRGRATPLELEQARGRVRTAGTGQLVLEGESADPLGIVRATLHRQTARVGFPLFADGPVEVAGYAAVAEVLGAVVVPDSPKLVVRSLLAAVWDEAVRLVAEGVPIDVIDDASAAVSRRPLLRSLDEVGSDVAASLVPRLRPFADAGVRAAFYHADRPREANALAQALLSAGPRLAGEEEDEEPTRDEIEARLRNRLRAEAERIGASDEMIAAAGLILPPLPAELRSAQRRAA